MYPIPDPLNWQPPAHWQKIKTVEMHTGGEPLRIPISGLPKIKGNTILEKRSYFKSNYDHLRTRMMFEPRGHADMYGAILTEPVSEHSDFGTFFLHNEGYSSMCGHAIIALTKFVLDTGLIQKEGASPTLLIDAPPGRITSTGHRKNGEVFRTSFLNVPSFLFLRDERIHVEGIGKVLFDIAYGGAFYVFTDADALGLEMLPENHLQLIDWGRKIKHAVMDKYEIAHPFEEDLSFLYGTIFTGKAQRPDHHSRNVCIFADGELDRSATGSGVSARAALHYAKGELAMGESITIESILGTTMDVKVTEEVGYGLHSAIIPEVSGSAHFCGANEIWIDPEDALKDGFIFR